VLVYSPQTGRSYLGTKPSRKTIARLCGEISELTGRRWGFIDTEEQVARINRKLEGWSNYFRLGPVSKAYRAVDRHTVDRLRQWLCRKHKVQGAGTTRYPYRYLYEKLKLVQLEKRRRNVPWANA
jgi:RNA-directed DNA polymerase